MNPHVEDNEALCELKIVSIIRSLYDGMTCQVIHNNELSSPFTVTTGVRQGLFALTDYLYAVCRLGAQSPHGPTKRFAVDLCKDAGRLELCRRHWTTVPLLQTHIREVAAPEHSCTANRTRDEHPENKEHEGQHSYHHTHPKALSARQVALRRTSNPGLEKLDMSLSL